VKFLLWKISGKIGITINVPCAEPKDADNPDDVEAAERALQMKCGWFCNPIFGNGDYPEVMKAQLAKASKELGLDRSPLPEFSEDEKRYNQGNTLSARISKYFVVPYLSVLGVYLRQDAIQIHVYLTLPKGK